MTRKIYLTSSMDNMFYLTVRRALKEDGHEVYSPQDEAPRLDWSKIDPLYHGFNAETFLSSIGHPDLITTFKRERDAVDRCDTCVLVTPHGQGSGLMAGYAAAKGKELHIFFGHYGFRPEVAYLMTPYVYTNINELRRSLNVGLRDA